MNDGHGIENGEGLENEPEKETRPRIFTNDSTSEECSRRRLYLRHMIETKVRAERTRTSNPFAPDLTREIIIDNFLLARAPRKFVSATGMVEN